jgi:hypothetical protein
MRAAIALAGEFAGRAPEETRARFEYVGSVLRWLLGDASGPSSAGAPSEAAMFLRTLAGKEIPRLERVRPGDQGWRVLATAAREPARRDDLLRDLLLTRLRRAATAGELSALRTLVERHGCDWRAWLRAPEGREAPFAHQHRYERPAYAMLAYNLDLPLPYDEYVAQDNRLATWFFYEIFPSKGYLPATTLLSFVRERDL